MGAATHRSRRGVDAGDSVRFEVLATGSAQLAVTSWEWIPDQNQALSLATQPTRTLKGVPKVSFSMDVDSAFNEPPWNLPPEIPTTESCSSTGTVCKIPVMESGIMRVYAQLDGAATSRIVRVAVSPGWIRHFDIVHMLLLDCAEKTPVMVEPDLRDTDGRRYGRATTKLIKMWQVNDDYVAYEGRVVLDKAIPKVGYYSRVAGLINCETGSGRLHTYCAFSKF